MRHVTVRAYKDGDLLPDAFVRVVDERTRDEAEQMVDAEGPVSAAATSHALSLALTDLLESLGIEVELDVLEREPEPEEGVSYHIGLSE